jgi:integrase
MARPPSEKLTLQGDHYKIRLHHADGTRPWFHFAPGMSEARCLGLLPKLREMAKAGLLVAETSPTDESVSDWFKRWAEAREARGLTCVRDDRGRFKKWIEPHIGSIAITKVTRAHIEKIRNLLDDQIELRNADEDEGISAKTAALIWGQLTTMFGSAQNAKRGDIKVREDNPTAGVEAPDSGDTKSRTYIYPDELRTLLECERVSISHRRCYALASYLACRKGELSALSCDDVDLEGGFIHVHSAADRRTIGATKSTKSGRARRIPIEPAIAPLLEVMTKDHAGRFVPVHERRSMADLLRDDMRTAGLTRTELFDSDRTRCALVFHDLRATAATWWVLRGDSHLAIKQRLGHADFKTTERYIREAEIFRAKFGEPFPALPACLLVPIDHPSDRVAWKKVKNIGRKLVGGTGFEAVTAPISEVFQQVSDKSSGSEGPSNPVLTSAPVISSDPIERALAGALEAAVAAAQWQVVGQLASELEARRLARANVVDLASVRRERGSR